MANLFFFGDSIAQGIWDERGGWVDRIKGRVMALSARAEQGFYCLPFNQAI